MKTKITISLLALLFIAGDFVGGCDEEKEPKPDYITVNVTAKGGVYKKVTNEPQWYCDNTHQGITVRVDIIKAGGEQFHFFPTTTIDCKFTSEMATFKLYREQPIEIIAFIESVPSRFTQVQGVDYLSWDEVYPQYDFGDTYNYTSEVTIIWLVD